MLIHSKRQISHMVLPQVFWRREKITKMARRIPIGFAMHRKVLPDDLMDCIEDIVELQSQTIHYSSNDFHIDDMQASIESRLAFQGRACRKFGVVAECCRLAAYICCYISFMETWASSFIPSRLSAMLLKLLSNSLNSSVWSLRHNLLLWLAFIGSCVAGLDRGHVDDLRAHYGRLLIRIHEVASSWPGAGTCGNPLQSALRDFVYCRNWLQCRMNIKEWFVLELFLGAPRRD
jgi:hypothetical protein